MVITSRRRHHFAVRKPAGQKQRPGIGNWERVTNKSQRRLTRVFDAWSTRVRKRLVSMAVSGASAGEQSAYFASTLPELEAELAKAVQSGLETATRVSAKSRAGLPSVQAVLERHLLNAEANIKNNLVPAIHKRLIPDIARGLAVNSKAISDSFLAVRNAPAQYAGTSWTMIFEVQKALGQEKDLELISVGKKPEPVRWVIDPAAEHCEASAGMYGCLDLQGEYDNWNALPTLPAADVTCRGNALLPNNIADATRVELISRMYYSGPAIEFITESGVKFSITANHPVLTPQGWLRAELLHKGDYVVNSTQSKTPMLPIDNNHKDIPATIEQIWNALSMISPIYTTPGSPIMPDDFHGDGRFMDGNVNIIFPLGQLRGDIRNPSGEQFSDYDSFHRGLLAQGSLPTQGAGMKVNSPPLTASNSVMVSRDLVLPLLGGHKTPFQLLRLALGTKMDSLSFESMGDCSSAYTQILSQLQDTFARLITLDKITDIIEFNYSGHVYDLQTDCGYYLLNQNISQRQGIVNSNCRCHLEVYREGQWQRGVYAD